MSRQHRPIRLDDGHVLAADVWPGDGVPVVLLHSGIGDRRSWYDTADLVAGHAFVLAYDRRGHGDSEPSEGGFRHVDDLLAVLARTAGQPAWLVASSAGGAVALDAVLLAPERVAGLVLLAPAVTGAPALEHLDADTERLDAAVERAVEEGEVARAARLELWLWLDGPAGPEGRVSGRVRELARDMDERVLRRRLSEAQGAGGLDHWAAAPGIRRPVVVAWGELDVPVLNERCAAFVDRLPQATGVVLPGVAHLPYLEQPARVAELVVDVLHDGDRARASGGPGDEG